MPSKRKPHRVVEIDEHVSGDSSPSKIEHASGDSSPSKIEHASVDSSSSKKARLQCQIGDVEVQWQYEQKSKYWLIYPPSEQVWLTAAYTSSKENVLVDGGQLVVDLKRLNQKTVATSYSRRVRLAVKASDGNFYAWHTADQRKRATWYSVANTLSLEKSFSEGAGEVKLLDDGKESDVNLKTMIANGKVMVVRLAAEALPSERPDTIEPEASEEKITSTIKVKQETAATSKVVAKSKGKSTDLSEDKSTEVVAKTIVVKGRAPVDSECKEKIGKAHVFCEGKDIWDCMLNQTYMQNNNNKYYLIQLLEDDDVKRYSVWMRWGRVGKRGQMTIFPCGPDLNEAKDIFTKKFRDKTKNDWSTRSTFEHVVGKYDLIKMDYSKGVDEVDSKEAMSNKKKPAQKPSSLDPRLQDLLTLICDVQAMEEAVIEMSYDARKAPLGMLTKDQIQAGNAALKTIETLVKKGSFGSALTQACNDFYTRIPHDFGMRTPPLIKSEDVLRDKLRLLEALADIEIAVRVLKEGDSSMHPLDRHYQSLKCDLKPMTKQEKMFKTVNDYLQTTHAATHSQYSMELLEVFECSKEDEKRQFVDHGNRMLLWHGSRITNWMGILCTGLRIAPPEAPVTGYMFGKGLYFSDMSSKSANYCFPTRTKDVGLIALCEVSLGHTNDLHAASYSADKLPTGKHSVKGVGKVAPDPATYCTLSDGTIVPIGKGVETAIAKESGYTLNYNEYIVYNTNQQKLRYICKVKFHFK